MTESVALSTAAGGAPELIENAKKGFVVALGDLDDSRNRWCFC
jgi:hypothetical protein